MSLNNSLMIPQVAAFFNTDTKRIPVAIKTVQKKLSQEAKRKINKNLRDLAVQHEIKAYWCNGAPCEKSMINNHYFLTFKMPQCGEIHGICADTIEVGVISAVNSFSDSNRICMHSGVYEEVYSNNYELLSSVIGVIDKKGKGKME